MRGKGSADNSSIDLTAGVEDVARGKHNRDVVGIERIAQRLRARLAQAGG